MIPGLKKRVFNFQDLLLYVALVRKHLRLLILLMCLAFMGSLTYYIYARPVYYSCSLVRVQSLALPVDAQTVFHDSNLALVVAQLQAPHLVERTARALGVDENYKEIDRKYLKK